MYFYFSDYFKSFKAVYVSSRRPTYIYMYVNVTKSDMPSFVIIRDTLCTTYAT